MSRRTIRIVALLLAILMVGASTLLGYDVFTDKPLTDSFVEPRPATEDNL